MVIVETRQFEVQSDLLMTADEKSAMMWFVALHPEAGDRIPGTGGARKLRWAVGSRGKRGGVRVVYYYRDEATPLFLLTVYKKGRKDDLSQAEQKTLGSIIKVIRDHYAKRK